MGGEITQSPAANIVVEVRFSKDVHSAILEIGDSFQALNKVLDGFVPQIRTLPYLVKMATKYMEGGDFLNATTIEQAELSVQELHDRNKDTQIWNLRKSMVQHDSDKIEDVVEKVRLFSRVKDMCEDYKDQLTKAKKLIDNSKAQSFDTLKRMVNSNHTQFVNRIRNLLEQAMTKEEAIVALIMVSQWWPEEPYKELVSINEQVPTIKVTTTTPSVGVIPVQSAEDVPQAVQAIVGAIKASMADQDKYPDKNWDETEDEYFRRKELNPE